MGDNDYEDDPSTFDQEMVDKDFAKWLEAMRSQIGSMHVNQVWTLVDPPEGKVPIRWKWV